MSEQSNYRLGDIVVIKKTYANLSPSYYYGVVFCKRPLYLYPDSGCKNGYLVRPQDEVYEVIRLPLLARFFARLGGIVRMAIFR